MNIVLTLPGKIEINFKCWLSTSSSTGTVNGPVMEEFEWIMGNKKHVCSVVSYSDNYHELSYHAIQPHTYNTRSYWEVSKSWLETTKNI